MGSKTKFLIFGLGFIFLIISECDANLQGEKLWKRLVKRDDAKIEGKREAVADDEIKPVQPLQEDPPSPSSAPFNSTLGPILVPPLAESPASNTSVLNNQTNLSSPSQIVKSPQEQSANLHKRLQLLHNTLLDIASKVIKEQGGKHAEFSSIPDIRNKDVKLTEPYGPTLFTVANTEIGRDWEEIPYREKFQWFVVEAPCHEIQLAVPNDRDSIGKISICLYRRTLVYDKHKAIILHSQDGDANVFEQRQLEIHGYVSGVSKSSVYGRYVNGYFYGEIELPDPNSFGTNIVYVVEEIRVLLELMNHSEKLIQNLMIVMRSRPSGSEMKYNAVVTIGTSLGRFFNFKFPESIGGDSQAVGSTLPFVVLSTGHNSYITSGEPELILEDSGRVTLSTPHGDVFTVETDGSVSIKTASSKVYTFRPNGKTILKEGLKITKLQEHEGSVAITAISQSLNFACVSPSPAFMSGRKGGYLCKICLAADNIFKQKYFDRRQNDQGNTNLVLSQFLGHIIDNASWYFRPIDWNGDGIPDNVGLDYDLQFLNWKYLDNGHEELSEEELDVMFNTLSSIDFSDCCLGIGFTMKKLPNDIFAMASQPKPSIPSGICSFPNEAGLSNNVILISGNDKKGDYSSLTTEQLVYLTTHEIAKAFGASLDTTGESICDSFQDSNDVTRHYILWPDVLRNIKQSEKSFSKCSIQSIQKTLGSCRSFCFDLDVHPFCGNGIQEEGEECDCGSETQCAHQYCCFGRSGKYPCHKTGLPCEGQSTGSKTDITFIIPSIAVLWILYLFQ